MPKKMTINHSLQNNNGKANNAYCINHAYQGKVSTSGSKKKYKRQCKLRENTNTNANYSKIQNKTDVVKLAL